MPAPVVGSTEPGGTIDGNRQAEGGIEGRARRRVPGLPRAIAVCSRSVRADADVRRRRDDLTLRLPRRALGFEVNFP